MLLTIAATGALTPLASGTAAAQPLPPGIPPIDAALAVYGTVLGMVVGLAVQLVVGGLLVSAAERYTLAVTDEMRREPVAGALVGIALFVGFVAVSVLLAVTVVGIVVLLPLAIAFAVVSLVGLVLASVLVGRLLLERGGEPRLMASLVVGSVLVAAAGAIPVLGGAIDFLLGSLGTGTVVARWWRRRGGRRRGRR